MTMAWDEVVLSVAQMGQADAWAVNAGVSGVALMDRAGSGMCDAITRRWARRPVVVLCGPGNNGGDGLVVARKLSEQGWPVTVALWAPAADVKGDALHHARLWLQAQAT
ncbi:MAG TPA: NAD(P)H-hydrate epimerase, partial [Aquabacterium sp.]|nr:NAD(P)H-hydrate epimerase [Aquabacterium sp.]